MSEEETNTVIVLAGERLKRLERDWEDIPPEINAFSRMLARRIDPTVTPKSFLKTAYGAIEEISGGIDQLTGEPIDGNLTPLGQTMLRIMIPVIAQKAFTPDFSDKVIDILEEERILEEEKRLTDTPRTDTTS